MCRILGSFAASVAAAVALLLTAPQARSAPVTWTVDTTVSYVNLTLSNDDYLIGGGPGGGLPSHAFGVGTGSLSGAQKGNLVPNVSTSVSQVGSAIHVSNVTLSPTMFGGLSGTATNLAFALSSGTKTIGAGGVVSMTGVSLLLTSGVLNVTGPVPATVDLSGFFPPLDDAFFGGTTSTLTNLGGGNFRWDIAINQGLGYPAGVLFPFTSGLTLDGFLRLAISVPEPGACVLLGLGLLSVAGLRRRSRAGH